MTGRILNDFEYKLQGQLNGNSSTFGESPRMIDMSLEWLRHKEFKVKIGQFKRPFSFENPMNPIDIGFNSQAQSIQKLAGFNDRTGEQSSSGRDIGVQVSGDLLPNATADDCCTTRRACSTDKASTARMWAIRRMSSEAFGCHPSRECASVLSDG